MIMPGSTATLQAVAHVAGVSAMTVSRMLRDSPHVSPATRERVQAALKAAHYQPDPHLARMMSLVRGRKQSRIRAVLGVIREQALDDELLQPAYQYVSNKHIRRRAEQHGYHIEEFWLGRGNLDPQRLAGILQARGIEGIIVSPQSARMQCAQLDYSPFAAATFGYGLAQPSLHRAAGNMSLGIHLAVNTLAARGYKRIGLAITRWVDARAEHAYSGAMLHFQEGLPKRGRVPLLLFPHNDLGRCFGVFRDWMKAHKPDALISFDTHVPDWLHRLDLSIPHDIGLVVHDWTAKMKGLAGIHQRREHVASAAVDLVATQLLQNERGVPEVPRQILIPPAWIEGGSIRPG